MRPHLSPPLPLIRLWQVISFVQLNQFMSARGYTFFVTCLYIMIGGLVADIALCLYVGYAFKNNRFDHVW